MICKKTKETIYLVSIFILAVMLCWTDSANADTHINGVYFNDRTIHYISSDSNITTSSDNRSGMRADDRGTIISAGDGISITTSGLAASGVHADDHAIIRMGGSAAIITSGDDAHGAFAYSFSSIDIGDSARIATSGKEAHGVYAYDDSELTIGSSSIIITSGDEAYGAVAWGFSSIDIGDSAKISTSGSEAHGVYTHINSSIDIGDSAVITTSGNDAFGVYAWAFSSIIIGDSSRISTSGSEAHGVYAYNNSHIKTGTDANISTSGESAHALYAYNNSSIQLNGGNISATGANSYAVYSERTSNITGSGKFNITGDMFAEGTSNTVNTLIDFKLEDGSTFTGKTSYTGNPATTKLNLTLNGGYTRWLVTGDSELSNLYMNDATVDMTQTFGITMTMENLGEFDSDKGVFKMDTRIISEDADMLIVTGTAKGSYILDITNRGADIATGAEITDMVHLQSGQTAQFTLGHIVECGGWQFALDSRSLISGETAWYLYSTGQTSATTSGAVNSFAGSYLMAYAETNTLMQRMGDLRDSEYLSGLWFKAHGGKFESKSKSYIRGFDMKYGGVHIGYDRKLENKWDGDLYLGAMFGYSRGDLDYSDEGSGKVDSKTLGIYGTYIRPNGFYIDTILKYQWMTNDIDVIDTAGTLVRGNDADTGGLGFSIEVGKRIPFSGNQQGGWYAEPQLQLSYQRQSGDYFNATNGLHIGVDSFTSLLGRAGFLVGYETENTNFYGKVSRVKEFDGKLTIRANGVPIAESLDSSWWVYGLGFTSKMGERNSLQLDIERTSGGSFRQPWRINAGWRIEL